MESSRDDITIAVRYAFLKKSNKQKFSLLALIIASIILLSLESINSKAFNLFRSTIKDVIYRTSFIISIPGNIISPIFLNISNHLNVYEKNKLLQLELEQLKNQQNQVAYFKTENQKLKKAIDDQILYSYDLLTSRVLLDKESPFLKSVILNKGHRNNVKKGMPVLKGYYFIGRITEVNYLSSRVLLINDLNSKIPVLIEPMGYQAIMTGSGEDFGTLDFLPKNHQLNSGSIVYTSGADGVIPGGIPIGKVMLVQEKYIVNFFSDLNQLYITSVIISKPKGNE